MAAHVMSRVIATEAAIDFISALRQIHGPLIFFQSGDGCDGGSPMCYVMGDFNASPTDIYLGNLGGAPFYMDCAQFEHWRHSQLIIDVVDGISGTFSLDNGTGKRFLTRSRLFPDAEYKLLE